MSTSAWSKFCSPRGVLGEGAAKRDKAHGLVARPVCKLYLETVVGPVLPCVCLVLLPCVQLARVGYRHCFYAIKQSVQLFSNICLCSSCFSPFPQSFSCSSSRSTTASAAGASAAGNKPGVNSFNCEVSVPLGTRHVIGMRARQHT